MSTIHIDEAGQAAEFHDVVQSVSITHLLQQRDAVLERLAQAFSILQEAHDIAIERALGLSQHCRVQGLSRPRPGRGGKIRDRGGGA